MAPRLLALLVLVLVTLPASPARAACTLLTVQSHTPGPISTAADLPPTVCVELRTDEPRPYTWLTITTRSIAQEQLIVWRAEPRPVTPAGLSLGGSYAKPISAEMPRTLGWYPAPNAVIFEVWEWRNSQLVGVTRYGWALPPAAPTAEAAAAHQVALPLLSR